MSNDLANEEEAVDHIDLFPEFHFLKCSNELKLEKYIVTAIGNESEVL